MWARANAAPRPPGSTSAKARDRLVQCAACTAEAAAATATAAAAAKTAAAAALVCSVCLQRSPEVEFSGRMRDRAATDGERPVRCRGCGDAGADASAARRAQLQADTARRLRVLDRLWGDVVPQSSKEYIARRVSEDVRREQEHGEHWTLEICPGPDDSDDRWRVALAQLPDPASYNNAVVRYAVDGNETKQAVGRVRGTPEDGWLWIDSSASGKVRLVDILHVPWTEARFLTSAFLLAYQPNTKPRGFGDLCHLRLRFRRSDFYSRGNSRQAAAARAFSYPAFSQISQTTHSNQLEAMVKSMPEEDLLEALEGYLRGRLEAEAATMLQMAGRCWLSRRWCDRLRAERVEQAALEEAVRYLTLPGVGAPAEFYPCARMSILVLGGAGVECSPYFGEVVGVSEDGDGWRVRRVDGGEIEVGVSVERLRPRGKPLAKDEREAQERSVTSVLAQVCWQARQVWSQWIGRWVRVKIPCRPWQRLLLAALGRDGMRGAPGEAGALCADLVDRIRGFLDESPLRPSDVSTRLFGWREPPTLRSGIDFRPQIFKSQVVLTRTKISPGEIGRVIDHDAGLCDQDASNPEQIELSLEKQDGV